jgi:hypothetical protein
MRTGGEVTSATVPTIPINLRQRSVKPQLRHGPRGRFRSTRATAILPMAKLILSCPRSKSLLALLPTGASCKKLRSLRLINQRVVEIAVAGTSSPILLMCSSRLEDRKWVWKLDTKGVAKDAYRNAVYQDERIHPKNYRH